VVGSRRVGAHGSTNDSAGAASRVKWE
jgi:hypothetical protein